MHSVILGKKIQELKAAKKAQNPEPYSQKLKRKRNGVTKQGESLLFPRN